MKSPFSTGSGYKKALKSRKTAGAAFDSAYFRKYYFDAATRVTTAAEMGRRAQLIAAVTSKRSMPPWLPAEPW